MADAMTSEPPNKLDLILSEIQELRRAVHLLTKIRAETLKDDLEWTRMPKEATRCAVTGLSRRKLQQLITDGTLRVKRRPGMTFFAAADWRKMMHGVE